MSLVNAEEATRSWESAVDIAAAMIAESRMPAMKPGKMSQTTSMKILFLPSGRRYSARDWPLLMRYVLPR